MSQLPYADPRERVETVILKAFEENYEIGPDVVAEVLVDEDVSNGQYEGCSSELEMWFCEYERQAEWMLR
jgi:hypothetical protein